MRLYGLRMWVEQSHKQVKHVLGWSDSRLASVIATSPVWLLVLPSARVNTLVRNMTGFGDQKPCESVCPGSRHFAGSAREPRPVVPGIPGSIR